MSGGTWRDDAPEVEMFGQRIPDFHSDSLSMVGCWSVSDPQEAAWLDEWSALRDEFEAEFAEESK